MDNRAIGIFDSGLGGLTCVKEVMSIMPEEDIVYFGDTSRVPYGTRSRDTIIKYVRQDINFLRTFDIKLIIIACGTAGSAAMQYVENDYDIGIVGVVEPAAREAVRISKNGKIGIIGTQGTINSGKYSETIRSINSDMDIVQQACPMFVPLVENGYTTGEVPRIIAEEYLKPLCDSGVDTVILGCTHYPLLKGVIYDIMGSGVNLIDAGSCAAKQAKLYMQGKDMLASAGKRGISKYFVSDMADNFVDLGEMFLQREIKGNIEQIDIEKY